MGFFSKAKKASGWMAIGLHKAGVSVVTLTRPASGLPKVGMTVFFPAEESAWPRALEKTAKELNAARYQCTTVLSPGEFQLLSVEAPNVPPEELKTAIRWRLKDMLDFHVDDATVDVLDVPMDKNAAARSHSMYAVAARNRLIEQRQALFSDAKIPLSVIDIPDLAQRNISNLLPVEGRGLAMLSVTADGGLLTVTYNGELYLSRRVDILPEQLIQGNEEQQRAVYDRVTLELQRSLDHFDRQYHFVTVSKLVLAPLGEGTVGLRDYLAANLYLPVEQLDLSSLLDMGNMADLKAPEAQQRFFMTLGAALRHEEKTL